MSRRAVVVALLAVVGLSLLGLLLVRPQPAGASSLSPSARGWLAARRYLEERGGSIELRSQPWDTGTLPDVLALAFPAYRPATAEEMRALEVWLHGGGVLVLGYSGSVGLGAERLLLDRLDLRLHDVLGRPPVSPRRWREYVDREWRLLPDATLGPRARDLRVRAPRFVPAAPRDANVLFRGPQDVAAVFEVRRGAGRVMVLPAEALANGRLGEPGHADLLEMLWDVHGGGPWSFDEYRHGLGAPASGSRAHVGATFDAFVLQLVLLYLAALLAVVRRFGPAWEDPPLQAASTAAFLRGLGVQHDRRRHHASAAALMVQRAQELHPWLKLPVAAAVADARALVGLARVVGRAQGGRPS